MINEGFGTGFGLGDKILATSADVNAPIQRAGIFSELPRLMAELGHDPEEVFVSEGLSIENLRPDTRLSFAAAARVLLRAAVVTDCPHIGLLLGQRFRMELHGVIGRLMMTAGNLGLALGDYVARQPGYSSGATVYLHRLGDHFALGYGISDPGIPDVQLIYDTILGVGVQMVHILTGGRVRPIEVHLGYREPSSLHGHHQAMRVPVRFNQQRTCLILDEAAMRVPVPTANAETRRQVLAEIEQILRPTMPTFSARVRQVLRHRMQLGDATMSTVANDTGQHVRTLRRRLADEGTTFERLRDEVRYMVARELLELTDLPVGDISAAVAMASPGVFSEAFRRWSGSPPSRWRPAVS